MKELILENFSNNIAIFQLENLMDTTRINTYMKSLPQGTIILFGEYVLEPFFSEQWKINPPQELKDKNKLDFLMEFCKEYRHTLVIPSVQYKNKGYYKNMVIFANGKSYTYTQQRMIQYDHWNEVNFFSNDTTKLPKTPFIFRAGNLKVGILFGFEAHFDEFWMGFKKACVDVVLVATASTFSSQERWKSLLTTHSFTNSCYVFRANRIGKYKANDGYEWDFYGHSFVSLGQKIIDSLNADEGMLCVELDTQSLQNLKDEWKFRE
ncbi:carbon-nitrogen hydrolase family protein [Helicobacter didelphidarum]|uniref:Carbon-nitrogen hydrolase family protein n=1 Tax=Helicobacter didelphidarum TaxID=2040648 RepID=A0A3D8IQX4_9HELI|nr:carbon-nitrogen hydrolase family protein [Helicobacter didelphidarum]RDU67659.1 carbon-nitrogen hydrolase family protein [Helicobacter didelphidarum]